MHVHVVLHPCATSCGQAVIDLEVTNKPTDPNQLQLQWLTEVGFQNNEEGQEGAFQVFSDLLHAIYLHAMKTEHYAHGYHLHVVHYGCESQLVIGYHTRVARHLHGERQSLSAITGRWEFNAFSSCWWVPHRSSLDGCRWRAPVCFRLTVHVEPISTNESQTLIVCHQCPKPPRMLIAVRRVRYSMHASIQTPESKTSITCRRKKLDLVTCWAARTRVRHRSVLQ